MGASSRRLRLLLLLALSAPAIVLGDGGTVQFQRQSGPFTVTLFSSVSPLRTGPQDLSVLVESATGNTPVLDANVSMELSFEKTNLTVRPSHAAATNKLLYVAMPDLDKAGTWQVDISVIHGQERSTARGTLTVLEGAPRFLSYWGYLAIVPILIALYLLNQSLKRKR